MDQAFARTTKLPGLVAIAAGLFLTLAAPASAANNTSSPQHRMTQDVELCESLGNDADYVQVEGQTMSSCTLDDGSGWICDHTGAVSECSEYGPGELVRSTTRVRRNRVPATAAASLQAKWTLAFHDAHR